MMKYPEFGQFFEEAIQSEYNKIRNALSSLPEKTREEML